MGIKTRIIKKAQYKRGLGRSLARQRRYVLGLSTRVSHAATVSVHTKKYLCADKCGGRFKYGGNRSAGLKSGGAVEFVEFIVEDELQKDCRLRYGEEGREGREEGAEGVFNEMEAGNDERFIAIRVGGNYPVMDPGHSSFASGLPGTEAPCKTRLRSSCVCITYINRMALFLALCNLVSVPFLPNCRLFHGGLTESSVEFKLFQAFSEP